MPLPSKEQRQRHQGPDKRVPEGSRHRKKIVALEASPEVEIPPFEYADSDDELGPPLSRNHSLTTASSSLPIAARIESKHCLDAVEEKED